MEKRKENKTPNRGSHSWSRSRTETRNINNRRDKSKSTERIVFPPRNNQNRSKTSNTEDIREKYDQNKRKIFPKDRKTSEKIEAIVITTNGNGWNVRIAEQEHNEVHINPKIQLSQGLKYIPTPKRNMIELKRDVAKFTRKLRLSEEKEIENEVDISLVKAKSSFHPPWNKNACFKLPAIINQILPNLIGKNHQHWKIIVN